MPKIDQARLAHPQYANQLLTNKQRLNREIATWRTLIHPNVAELLGIARLWPGCPQGLVSRYVQRHDFLGYIGRHPELKLSKVFINCSVLMLGVDAQFMAEGSRGSLWLKILARKQCCAWGHQNCRWKCCTVLVLYLFECLSGQRPHIRPRSCANQ
jgi:hypothetical protein